MKIIKLTGCSAVRLDEEVAATMKPSLRVSLRRLLFSATLFASMVAYPEFYCDIQVPAGGIGVSRKATVTYCNDGTSAIAAPYVRLEAGANAYVRFSETDAWSKSVEFLATSDQSPASSLRAGETVKIPVFVCTATEKVQMTISYTQSSSEAFPWADIGSSLKPSYVADSAWTFAIATLKSRFGTTWNSYLSRLRANADYLAENGRPIRCLDRLLQIEINHALGVDAVLPVLASVTDAARSARGMGLSFTRSYSSAMYGRFTSGILGYGWTDNLSTYAELTDSKTLVFRVPGGGSYSFTKATGSWQPEDSRDKTILSESSTAYTLTYQSGVKQTFAKSNMRTSSIVDNCGNTLTFTWSGTTLQKIAHTDGQALTFAYSGGRLCSVTDDCGRQTTYAYSNSLLTQVTASDGLVTSYEYRSADGTAAARALSRIVYPDGTTREFAYDTSSGLVSAISSNGGSETTTISREGRVVTLTDPDGAETTVKMGGSGEVLKTTDALGGTSTKGYTEDGLLKSVVSPSGLNGKIEHDALGRVSKSVSAAGTTTAFKYEGTFGNLKKVTDAKNNTVTYGYDAKGHGTSVTFADGSASKLEYNNRGDVVKSTNRRGQTVTYAYDAKGRVTKKTWSSGRTFTYVYDSHGNVTTATDSETGAVTMQYDAADRLTKITYPRGRGFTFTYDSCGRLAVRTSLDGAAEWFAYDALGRLASVSDGNGTTYLQNIYDATTGRLAKQVNGNGTSVSYLYDKLGRVVSIEHCDAEGGIVESLQYCYDADGRCIRASSLLGEERYGYDKEGQLISVRYPDLPSEAFAYDAVGNRMIANGSIYTVNNLNQYTAISGGVNPVSAITYDKDGNMTSVTDANGTTTYAYDTLNRLISVKNAAKGINWSCQYDVFGNRVSVTDNGVTTERTYLQGSLPSVAVEYVNGQLKERHIVVGAVRIADVAATPSSSRYYHADLIGSTRLVTDGSGAIVDRRAYKAFGETRVGNDETATAGYVGTLGVETDSTGLLFMRNRYYSPALGRFIQMDPIGLNAGDVNVYSYSNNQPLQNNDPEGFVSWNSAAGTISGVLGFGVGKNKTLADYGAGLAINSLYGDGLHNVRIMGGGGLTLSAANKTAQHLEYGGRIIGGAAKVLGNFASAYTIYQDFAQNDYVGVGVDIAKTIAYKIPNPWVRAMLLAWDVGKLAGEIAFELFGDKGGRVNTAMITDINNKIAEQMSSDSEYTMTIAPDGGNTNQDEVDDFELPDNSVKEVSVRGSFTISFEWVVRTNPKVKYPHLFGTAVFNVDGVEYGLGGVIDENGMIVRKENISVTGEGIHSLRWVVELFTSLPVTYGVRNVKIVRTAKKSASVVMSAKAASKNVLTSAGNGATSPRLYCYERHVAVKGQTYGFALSADDDASISVSGLPSGFSFSDGYISGTASAAGTTTVTITASGSAGTTTKRVEFVVIEAPEDFQPIISLMSHPDLRPSMVSSWGAPLVVSTSANPTRGATSFLDTDSLYVSWLVECGNVNAEETFYTCLYVDDVLEYYWYTDGLSRDGEAGIVGYALEALSVGTHRIMIVTDASGAVTESDESNNSYETTITVVRDWFPALSVSSMSVSKTSISVSESATVHWRVENNGDAAAKKTQTAFQIFKYDPSADEFILKKTEWLTCNPLAAGAGRECTRAFAGKTFGVGEYIIRVWVDGKGDIYEKNESDNYVMTRITVTKDNATRSTSSVDWQFKKLNSKEPDSFFLSASSSFKKKTTTFKVGQTIYMRCCWWNAKKGAVSGDMRIRVLLNGSPGIFSDRSYFKKGWWYYLTDTSPDFLQNLPAGKYTLTAVLDSENNWTETNEKNNIRTISFTVVAAPTIYGEATYTCALNESVNWPVSSEGSMSVKGLPKGMKYSGGVISGKASKTGTYTVKFTSKNAAGTRTKTIKIVVVNPGFDVSVNVRANGATDAATVASGGTVPMYIGVEQKITVASTPGKSGIAKSGASSVKASGLPPGLKYANGVISGVPSKTGTYTVKLVFRNAIGWSKTFTMKMVVKSLPAWARGSFNGWATTEDSLVRKVTFSVTSAGKISAKVGTLAFSRTGWTVNADGTYGATMRTVRTTGSGKKKKSYTDVLTLRLNPAAAWTEDQLTGYVATFNGNVTLANALASLDAIRDYGLQALVDYGALPVPSNVDVYVWARRNPYGDASNEDAQLLAQTLSALGTLKFTDKSGIAWNIKVAANGVATLSRTTGTGKNKKTISATAVVMWDGGETKPYAIFIAEGNVMPINWE